jgi:hypothetical protein
VFSGGTYQEVERWLRNFLTAHAKRVDPRLEVVFDHDDGREGNSYGVRLRLGHRLTPTLELGFREVADNRGALVWCTTLAEHVKRLARELIANGAVSDARPR